MKSYVGIRGHPFTSLVRIEGIKYHGLHSHYRVWIDSFFIHCAIVVATTATLAAAEFAVGTSGSTAAGFLSPS